VTRNRQIDNNLERNDANQLPTVFIYRLGN